jgi:hypothetical protein
MMIEPKKGTATVSKMTNPMDALISLQREVRSGIEMQPGEKHPGLRVLVDRPNGHLRYTYARIEHGRVKAIVLLLMNDPVGELPHFSLGYAVPETYRNRGWATEIVKQSLEEMSLGLMRNRLPAYILDAVVGHGNIASQRVAAKIFGEAPLEIIDEESGEPALSYCKLIELEIKP